MQSDINIKFHFRCIIGILNFERHKKQKVIIKIKAKSTSFLNYAKVISSVKKTYKKEKFHTLEESLKFNAKKLKKKFPSLFKLKIKAYKPEILKNAKVGVRLKKSWSKLNVKSKL